MKKRICATCYYYQQVGKYAAALGARKCVLHLMKSGFPLIKCSSYLPIEEGKIANKAW